MFWFWYWIWQVTYSWTSRWLPKISNLGGRLREVYQIPTFRYMINIAISRGVSNLGENMRLCYCSGAFTFLRNLFSTIVYAKWWDKGLIFCAMRSQSTILQFIWCIVSFFCREHCQKITALCQIQHSRHYEGNYPLHVLKLIGTRFSTTRLDKNLKALNL